MSSTAEESDGGSAASSPASDADSTSGDEAARLRKVQELEARAVDKAKATADAAFRPSPSVLNAPSASVLMEQVDGPSLATYEGKESVYVGRAVPVAAGTKLNVPIQVTAPGSVVEYSVELKNYDIGFAISAERDEGVTIVKVRVSRNPFFFFLFWFVANRGAVVDSCRHFLIFPVLLTLCVLTYLPRRCW